MSIHTPITAPTAHERRVMEARRRNLCFACAHYTAPFKRFSAPCTKGGLDPDATAREFFGSAGWQAARIVSWANSCPRFDHADFLADLHLPTASEASVPAGGVL